MSSLTQMWASLGVAFHSDSTKVSTSPEEGIISFLKSGEFPKDRILLPLILGWLKENSKIVHVERLKNLSIHLSDFEAALLGVMAKKCVQNKDHRWNSIIKFVKEKIGEKIFEEGLHNLDMKVECE